MLVISAPDQIDQLTHAVSFDERTNSAGSKVRVELGQSAEACRLQPLNPSPPH